MRLEPRVPLRSQTGDVGLERADDVEGQRAELDGRQVVAHYHQLAVGGDVERDVQLPFFDALRDLERIVDAGGDLLSREPKRGQRRTVGRQQRRAGGGEHVLDIATVLDRKSVV